MNLLLRISMALLLVGLASATFAANVDSYYFWNLTEGEGWLDDGSLWTSEDGATTGYVPATIPDAGATIYRQWAVFRNAGKAKIDAAHLPWGPSTNYPQNIWVGHGSTTYKPGPFAPSEGHVVQTGGEVGYESYFHVAREYAPGISTYDLEGGSLKQIYTGTGYFIIGDSYATGVMTVSNNAVISAPTGVGRVGDGAGAVGTLSMNGTSRLTANYLTAGFEGASGAIATGTVTLGGQSIVNLNFDVNVASSFYTDGELNVEGEATLTMGRRLNIGDNSSWTYRDAWATGSMDISDNATVTTPEIRIGKYQYGIGAATVASSTGTATLNATGSFAVGIAGGHGELIVGDGGVVNHTAGWLDVGSDTRSDPQGLEVFTSTGAVTMNGGTFNHTDVANGIALGIDGQTGAWTQNGGTLVSASSVWFGQSGGHALLNLNGGTFQVPSIAVDQTSAPAAARVNFNGGTLKAGADANLIVDSLSPVLQLVVQSGGAIIDSNGYDVAITPALVEDPESTGGGLTKLGTGALTLGGANTYQGATSILEGVLVVDGSITSDVSVADAAALMGSGTIDGSVVAGSGAKVGPGSSIGSLTVTGDLALGGTLDVEYDSASGLIDLVAVSGQLDLTGGTFSFSDLGSATLANGAYVFATYGSLIGEPVTELGVPGNGSVDYHYGGNRIALVAVPEPSGVVLVGLLASLLFVPGTWRRRR